MFETELDYLFQQAFWVHFHFKELLQIENYSNGLAVFMLA